MKYSYKTTGTCSRSISFEINGNIITEIKYEGGCGGNTKGIASLADGLTVEEIEKRCGGINCGNKGTSCPDQLAKAVREAYNNLK